MCAPGLTYEGGSCAKLVVLIELAKAYNKTVNDKDQIKLSTNIEILNPKKYKQYLVNEISKRVGDKCTNQKCWTKQEFIHQMEDKAREEFMKYTFRPDSPQGKYTWLSTYDIDDAMRQYEKIYPDYKFFGAVPMDFAKLYDLEISNPDYADYYKKGKKRLGLVLNLDDHDQSGSHWVSLFTDLEKGCIYYFDSVGVKPEPRVRALMRKQAEFMKSMGKNLDDIKIDYNKVQHQKKNTECGVYSINFLVRMLRGDDFNELCNSPVVDDRINKCRKVYFDKYNKKR